MMGMGELFTVWVFATITVGIFIGGYIIGRNKR